MPGKQGTRAAVQPRSQGFHASSATLASQADSGQAGKEAGALGLTALGTQSGGSHLSHQGASHQGSGGFGSSDEQSPTSVARQSQGGTAVAAEQSQGQAQPIFSASQASAGSAIHQGHSLMPPAVQALPASSTPVVTIPQETPFPQPVQAVHLEVHPPHLGEVHLRVVLANQTVHTHVTLEHSELGQTLLARQGHLENALNASGLDLGQFRVLIDRHGSGQAGQEWATDAQHHRGQQDESDRESSLPGEKQEIWMNEVEQRRHINLVA